MNSTQRFQLINGTFAPEDAKEVLLSLLRNKMAFHTLQLVSNRERYGSDLLDSELRLGELEQMQASIKALLEPSTSTHRKVKVDGWIEISFGFDDP